MSLDWTTTSFLHLFVCQLIFSRTQVQYDRPSSKVSLPLHYLNFLNVFPVSSLFNALETRTSVGLSPVSLDESSPAKPVFSNFIENPLLLIY